MPVGVKLIDLRRDLRAETGQSLNPAQGVQSQLTQDNQLDRQQRELWDAYQWPHLRYWMDMQLYANQSTYDYPEEMPFDTINRMMWTGDGTRWQVLAYGLHGFDTPLSSTPQPVGNPARWGNVVTVTGGKTDPVGKFRVVPTPTLNSGLRIEGQAPCNPLIADDDTCVIDSKAIVLFAAAEILAVNKVEAASLKLTKAQNYLRKLLANSGADKRANYNMGGNHRIDHFGARPYRNYVPGIDYIP